MADEDQGRIQKYGLEGVKGWGLVPSPRLPFPSRPLTSPPFPAPFPLEVGPLNNPARGLGSAVSSSSGVWGGAPAEIEFGTF